MIGVVFGIIGARLYYVIFSWDMYKDNLLEILNIREGGLAIYGGVIAAVLTVIIVAKVKHLSAPQIFDTIALALLNGQMLGRWGNFFNREAFGGIYGQSVCNASSNRCSQKFGCDRADAHAYPEYWWCRIHSGSSNIFI